MKTYKNFSLLVALTFILSLGLTSCEKYEEGPSLSLLSKKQRMTGTWLVVENDGDEVEEDLTYSMEADGDITMTYRDGNASFSFDGQWDFAEDKDHIFTEFGDDIDKFKIIRLKNKELILENQDDERIVFEKQDDE